MDNIIVELLDKNDMISIQYILNNLDSLFCCSWSKDQLATFILGDNYLTYIAKKDNDILGFLVVSNTIDTIDILIIVVNIHFRRMKIATKLITRLINIFTSLPIILEVNTNNEPAINLYKSLGFITISIRKGYYLNKKTNTKEDAYIMKF